MALTPTILFAFALIVVGLPMAVTALNRWKRYAGWWLLAAFIALIIAGNVAEKLITGTSAIF
ncbi:MAG: hypothetical protein ABIT68_06300 [Sphingomicrobium sp.]